MRPGPLPSQNQGLSARSRLEAEDWLLSKARWAGAESLNQNSWLHRSGLGRAPIPCCPLTFAPLLPGLSDVNTQRADLPAAFSFCALARSHP